MLQLTARLFNATIVAADGEVPVWDPSVRFFKVYRDGALKGYLYIDPYARPGGELCIAKDDLRTQGCNLRGPLHMHMLALSPAHEIRSVPDGKACTPGREEWRRMGGDLGEPVSSSGDARPEHPATCGSHSNQSVSACGRCSLAHDYGVSIPNCHSSQHMGAALPLWSAKMQ